MTVHHGRRHALLFQYTLLRLSQVWNLRIIKHESKRIIVNICSRSSQSRAARVHTRSKILKKNERRSPYDRSSVQGVMPSTGRWHAGLTPTQHLSIRRGSRGRGVSDKKRRLGGIGCDCGPAPERPELSVPIPSAGGTNTLTRRGGNLCLLSSRVSIMCVSLFTDYLWTRLHRFV